MSALAFDSLRFARRLKEAGVPEPQAEAQAELMAETFGYYVDNLVTKDYLDARLDASFAEQDARIDARFAQQKSLLDSRFAERDLQIEKLQSAMDGKFNVMAGKFNVMTAVLALIAASVVPGAISNLLAG